MRVGAHLVISLSCGNIFTFSTKPCLGVVIISNNERIRAPISSTSFTPRANSIRRLEPIALSKIGNSLPFTFSNNKALPLFLIKRSLISDISNSESTSTLTRNSSSLLSSTSTKLLKLLYAILLYILFKLLYVYYHSIKIHFFNENIKLAVGLSAISQASKITLL